MQPCANGLSSNSRPTITPLIAGRMFVAEKSEKNCVSHVLTKLGMTSRTQVAVLATHVHDEQARRAG